MEGIIDILSSADLSRKGELSKLRIEEDFNLIRNKTIIRFKTIEDFFRFESGFLYNLRDRSISIKQQEKFIEKYYKNTLTFTNNKLNETWLLFSEDIDGEINNYLSILDQ